MITSLIALIGLISAIAYKISPVVQSISVFKHILDKVSTTNHRSKFRMFKYLLFKHLNLFFFKKPKLAPLNLLMDAFPDLLPRPSGKVCEEKSSIVVLILYLYFNDIVSDIYNKYNAATQKSGLNLLLGTSPVTDINAICKYIGRGKLIQKSDLKIVRKVRDTCLPFENDYNSKYCILFEKLIFDTPGMNTYSIQNIQTYNIKNFISRLRSLKWVENFT